MLRTQPDLDLSPSWPGGERECSKPDEGCNEGLHGARAAAGHGLKNGWRTVSPAFSPIAAASPPLSSSTARHGGPEGMTRSDRGSALATTLVTLPAGEMKIISSGIYVFFIQKATGASRSNSNSMPRSAGM